MNHKSDHEQMLADVFSENTGFREALLDQTLRLARGRRRARQTRRAAVALTGIILFAILIWRNLPSTTRVAITTPAGCRIVRTQPLPASAMVTTQPFSGEHLVASVAMSRIVTTTEPEELREISDQELFSLVGPRPAALVWIGPHRAELIFANPEDQKGFPAN